MLGGYGVAESLPAAFGPCFFCFPIFSLSRPTDHERDRWPVAGPLVGCTCDESTKFDEIKYGHSTKESMWHVSQCLAEKPVSRDSQPSSSSTQHPTVWCSTSCCVFFTPETGRHRSPGSRPSWKAGPNAGGATASKSSCLRNSLVARNTYGHNGKGAFLCELSPLRYVWQSRQFCCVHKSMRKFLFLGNTHEQVHLVMFELEQAYAESDFVVGSGGRKTCSFATPEVCIPPPFDASRPNAAPQGPLTTLRRQSVGLHALLFQRNESKNNTFLYHRPHTSIQGTQAKSRFSLYQNGGSEAYYFCRRILALNRNCTPVYNAPLATRPLDPLRFFLQIFSQTQPTAA